VVVVAYSALQLQAAAAHDVGELAGERALHVNVVLVLELEEML
jgi:hypothetical protein